MDKKKIKFKLKEQPPYFIMTAPNRDLQYKNTLKSLEVAGIEKKRIKKIMGFDYALFPDMKKKYALLLKAFTDKFLPEALKFANKGIGSYWIEDGSKLQEKPKLIDKSKINWLGYINHMKHYTVGSKFIYFPPAIIKDLYNKKDTIKPQHIDRFIKNYGEKNNKLVVAPKSFVYQTIYERATPATKAQLKGKEASIMRQRKKATKLEGDKEFTKILQKGNRKFYVYEKT